MNEIYVVDVPEYLRVSGLYLTRVGCGYDMIDVPYGFYKENDMCENNEDMKLLFNTCSYWDMPDLTESLYRYVSNGNQLEAIKLLASFNNSRFLIFLKEITSTNFYKFKSQFDIKFYLNHDNLYHTVNIIAEQHDKRILNFKLPTLYDENVFENLINSIKNNTHFLIKPHEVKRNLDLTLVHNKYQIKHPNSSSNTIQGPMGPLGVIGPTGLVGSQGVTGSNGTPGIFSNFNNFLGLRSDKEGNILTQFLSKIDNHKITELNALKFDIIGSGNIYTKFEYMKRAKNILTSGEENDFTLFFKTYFSYIENNVVRHKENNIEDFIEYKDHILRISISGVKIELHLNNWNKYNIINDLSDINNKVKTHLETESENLLLAISQIEKLNNIIHNS